jgi:hypothetical protein
MHRVAGPRAKLRGPARVVARRGEATGGLIITVLRLFQNSSFRP